MRRSDERPLPGGYRRYDVVEIRGQPRLYTVMGKVREMFVVESHGRDRLVVETGLVLQQFFLPPDGIQRPTTSARAAEVDLVWRRRERLVCGCCGGETGILFGRWPTSVPGSRISPPACEACARRLHAVKKALDAGGPKTAKFIGIGRQRLKALLP